MNPSHLHYLVSLFLMLRRYKKIKKRDLHEIHIRDSSVCPVIKFIEQNSNYFSEHYVWLKESSNSGDLTFSIFNPSFNKYINLLVLNCYFIGIKKEYGMNSDSGAGISTLSKCR